VREGIGTGQGMGTVKSAGGNELVVPVEDHGNGQNDADKRQGPGLELVQEANHRWD